MSARYEKDRDGVSARLRGWDDRTCRPGLRGGTKGIVGMIGTTGIGWSAGMGRYGLSAGMGWCAGIWTVGPVRDGDDRHGIVAKGSRRPELSVGTGRAAVGSRGDRLGRDQGVSGSRAWAVRVSCGMSAGTEAHGDGTVCQWVLGSRGSGMSRGDASLSTGTACRYGEYGGRIVRGAGRRASGGGVACQVGRTEGRSAGKARVVVTARIGMSGSRGSQGEGQACQPERKGGVCAGLSRGMGRVGQYRHVARVGRLRPESSVG